MSRQLAMPAAGPTRDFSREQFFTPPETAARLAAWVDELLGPYGTVLEPSAGDGGLLRALRAVRPDAAVDAFEVDARHATRLKAHARAVYVGDFLEADVGRYDAVIANPPFAHDGEFLARAMDHADLVVMLLPTASLEGVRRRELVWSRVEAGRWVLRRLAICSRRPRFGGPHGGGSRPICAVQLVRETTGEEPGTRVEWW